MGPYTLSSMKYLSDIFLCIKIVACYSYIVIIIIMVCGSLLIIGMKKEYLD